MLPKQTNKQTVAHIHLHPRLNRKRDVMFVFLCEDGKRGLRLPRQETLKAGYILYFPLLSTNPTIRPKPTTRQSAHQYFLASNNLLIQVINTVQYTHTVPSFAYRRKKVHLLGTTFCCGLIIRINELWQLQ